MTSRFVSNFRRSLSFPNQTPSKPPKLFHVRSISLPYNSHPLISLLRTDLLSLSSWESSCQLRTSAWVVDGLTRLRAVHEYLYDIIQLPKTQDSLQHIPNFVEKVLEAFLNFVDVFGTFQTLIISLKHENSTAQMSLRRNNYSKIPLFMKDLKKIGKDMEQLISAVQLTEKCDEIVDIDLGDVIGGVIDTTVLVCVLMFNGISTPLSRNTTTSLKGLRLLNKGRRETMQGGIEEFEKMRREWLKREKGDEGVRLIVLKRMQEMERCIGEIEICSERVYRSLINTRVSLLNVVTNKY